MNVARHDAPRQTEPRAARLFKGPLAETLLRFTLLPSLLAHEAAPPSRLRKLPSNHRLRSLALMQQHGLGFVLDMDDPALPLAALPKAHFQHLQLVLGAALNAPHIRHTISRIERAKLHEQIGADGMTIVGTPTAAALKGLPVEFNWHIENAKRICLEWGGAVLGQAFEAASPEVGRRALLRLPPGSDPPRATLSAAELKPQTALRISLDLLQIQEPEWVSSFPASR